jgi:hypothetical protein
MAKDDSSPDERPDFAARAAEKRPGVVSEFWYFLRTNKKWWLTPIIVMMLLLGLLILVGGSAAAPFIYTLF